MEPIIVTGADGFIGTHLLKSLNMMGIPVFALIMRESTTKGRITSLDHVKIIECNFSRLDEVEALLPRRAMAFYHFAWAGVAPESRSSMELQQQNIALALSATSLAGRLQAQRFILPGSTMEYLYSGKPINRYALPTPENSYGAAKLASRYLCEALAHEMELPFIYTVATGVYGEGRRDNNVISYTINALLRNQCPHLTRLEQCWDYIHINDLVKALCLIGQHGKSGAFYTIGHGDNWPLIQYIREIHAQIDETLPLGIGDIPYRTNRLPSSCVDLTELQTDTGFIPEITFSDGIKGVISNIAQENQKLN